MSAEDSRVNGTAAGVLSGQTAAVARAITWCEQGGERAAALLAKLPPRSAHVIGLTGSPGVGKSTLLSTLVAAHVKRGKRLGVIAVDPSSPITGGALLADRVRLEAPRTVFFRSLASRGAAGGLSNATWAATRVLSAAGFDTVLVETVGAGQAEVRIMRVADSVVLVLIPGAGDEMQAMKSGIMEIADVYVLNKADLPGINDLKMHVRDRLRLRPASDWTPPVVLTVALEGGGIDEVVAALERHRQHLAQGLGRERSDSATREETARAAREALEQALAEVIASDWQLLAAALAEGTTTEPEAAGELARRAAERVAGHLGGGNQRFTLNVDNAMIEDHDSRV